MENIWTKINDEIPIYMKYLCEKYNLFCAKICPLKTAIVGKGFALIITIDRFDTDVFYVYKEGKDTILFSCGNYFAEKYNEEDRVNLLCGSGADILVRNDIIVTTNGLISKWGDVLEGKREWIDKYKKSSRYSVGRLPDVELKKIESYF
jgi:hypothetical protein